MKASAKASPKPDTANAGCGSVWKIGYVPPGAFSPRGDHTSAKNIAPLPFPTSEFAPGRIFRPYNYFPPPGRFQRGSRYFCCGGTLGRDHGDSTAAASI